MRLILATAILVVPIVAAAQDIRPVASRPVTATTAPAVDLTARYTDRLHGFSLCPPLGTERIRQTSPRRLVGWAKRDKKTGAIRWSLEVLQTKHKPSKLLLSEYAAAVAKRLAKTNNFEVQSTRIALVAGKPAIHFRGIWKGAFKLWRRQTWVSIDPGKHLVLDIAGATTDADEMDAVLTAVLGSLRLFDPKVAISEERENLARGEAVLKKLSIPVLRPLLADRPYYCTIQLKGKIIGFLMVTETIAKRSGVQGLLIVRRGALNIPDQPRRLTWEELFTTADQAVECWKQVTLEGQGPSAVRVGQEGIKQEYLILVHTTRPGRPRQSRKREIPRTVRQAYLPQALGVLATRLIDRSKPTAYGFAVYNAVTNDFDPRVIRIVGPETIVTGGKKVAAVRLTDQMAPNDPLVSLWVDKNGTPLRMCTAGGLTIERADRKAVVARFAAELLELDKLEKSSR